MLQMYCYVVKYSKPNPISFFVGNGMEPESHKSRKQAPPYTPEEDEIIVRSAYEMKVFCKPKKGEGFEKGALRQKDSEACKRETVTGRSVRDRFYSIDRRWRTADNAKRAMWGTAEIVTELDEILSNTVLILDDIDYEKKAIKEADRKRQ